MNDQIEAEPSRGLVSEGDHLAELPCRIDMQKRKGQFSRMKCLHRKVQQYCRVLADRIEQDRIVTGRCDLSNDEDGFGFELLKMGQLDHGADSNARTSRPSAST